MSALCTTGPLSHSRDRDGNAPRPMAPGLLIAFVLCLFPLGDRGKGIDRLRTRPHLLVGCIVPTGRLGLLSPGLALFVASLVVRPG